QTTVTDGLGRTTTTTFDKDNRPIAVTELLSTTGSMGNDAVTTTVYDAVGNVVRTIDPLNETTTYVYNALNQQIATIDPLSRTTTTVWDGVGQQVGALDGVGDLTQFVFDPAGRPVATVDAKGGVLRTLLDAVGGTAGVIDPMGNTTLYVDDVLGREISHSNALGDTTTTTYDAAGNISSVTDADGRTITYSYDAVNQETGATWKSSTGAVVNTLTFSYDNVGNQLTAANNAGNYTFTYDALNRTSTQTDLYGLSLTYTYNAAALLTQRQDSLGGLLTLAYDPGERLSSQQLSAGGQTMRIDPGYDNRSDLTSLTRYADVSGTTLLGTTVYSYDAAGGLASIVNENASHATLSSYHFSYDSAARLSSQQWHSQVGTVVYNGALSYTYDLTGQLTAATGLGGNNTYSYDQNGNRTLFGYQTGGDNRLTTDGVWTYTYDNAGNLVQKGNGAGTTWTYSYDNANELLSAVETVGGTTSLVASYSYDVFGNLVQEQHWTNATGTVTVRHAYDGSNAWADVDTSNAVLARYVYGEGADQVWGRMIPTGQPNAGVSWYLTDQLGSVRDIVNGSQVLTNHIDYDPFGSVVKEANSSVSDAYKYAAGRTDNATGLVKFGARWYNPATGAWIEQDPSGLGPDSNPYRYVGNDPTNAIDTSGLIGIFLDGAGQNGENPAVVNEIGESIIHELYTMYKGKKKYFPVEFFSVPENPPKPAFIPKTIEPIQAANDAIAWAFQEWDKLTPAQRRTEKFDIFGWSRGAVYAVKVAQNLWVNRKNDESIPVRFHWTS
ncbi:MAG TPA: RHS repeat-associated core domain-containing protein, partial [Gemmataceae bacterium]